MKTIIEMGKEAGLINWGFVFNEYEVVPDLEAVERFAAIVRADERETMVAEAAKKGWAMRGEDPFEDCVREIANIRARGNT